MPGPPRPAPSGAGLLRRLRRGGIGPPLRPRARLRPSDRRPGASGPLPSVLLARSLPRRLPPSPAMRLSAAAWISHGRVQRRMGRGPRSRLDLLRNLVTGLVRHERIETTLARADEMRNYAERLIDYGKRGDTDPKAMRMADFWLTEKDLIHKLFKVLAPRYQSYSRNYTRMLQIPNRENLDRARMAVIEYKGNHLPPLPIPCRDSEKTLVNQLLKGYRDDVLRAKGAPLGEGHVGTAV